MGVGVSKRMLWRHSWKWVLSTQSTACQGQWQPLFPSSIFQLGVSSVMYAKYRLAYMSELIPGWKMSLTTQEIVVATALGTLCSR